MVLLVVLLLQVWWEMNRLIMDEFVVFIQNGPSPESGSCHLRQSSRLQGRSNQILFFKWIQDTSFQFIGLGAQLEDQLFRPETVTTKTLKHLFWFALRIDKRVRILKPSSSLEV